MLADRLRHLINESSPKRDSEYFSLWLKSFSPELTRQMAKLVEKNSSFILYGAVIRARPNPRGKDKLNVVLQGFGEDDAVEVLTNLISYFNDLPVIKEIKKEVGSDSDFFTGEIDTGLFGFAGSRGEIVLEMGINLGV